MWYDTTIYVVQMHTCLYLQEDVVQHALCCHGHLGLIHMCTIDTVGLIGIFRIEWVGLMYVCGIERGGVNVCVV
jgi:hypothetical protein